MNQFLYRIISVYIVIVVIAGCKSDDDISVNVDNLVPPSNLKAVSLPNDQVKIVWDASTTSGSGTFQGYQVVVTNSTTNITTDSVLTTNLFWVRTSSDTTDRGKTFTFSVRTMKTNGQVSDDVSIHWGVALRHPFVRVYEVDHGDSSGVEFLTGSSLNFYPSSPPIRQRIDLWIDGEGEESPKLKSPSEELFSETGWRTTKLLATNTYSLDLPVDVPSPNAMQSNSPIEIVAGKVYWAFTNDGHYARFQISSSGIEGNKPDRYIRVAISYNPGFDAWAKQ